MKVLLLTHGSRGDVQPFAALARRLNSAGHEALLGAPDGSADLVRSYGLRLVPLADTWSRLASDPVVRAAFETNYSGMRGKRLAIQVMRKFRPILACALDDMAAIAESGVDLVVYQPSVPGHQIAERLGVPAVPVCLEPSWVPTRAFSNPMVPFRVPNALNRFSYLWTYFWMRGFMGNTRRWRRETLGLPRRRGYANPLLRPDGSPTTVLQAFSRYMLPTSLDYPHWVHTTGFWFLPAPSNWTPPQQLCDFLASGTPPVYIGFGSMAGVDPSRTGRLVLEAVRLSGVRAVVVAGYGGIHSNALVDDDVYLLDQAPFDWLFPRMGAIVHHGGSGTTGAALAAGRPQVVCPFMTTQPFFAKQMHAVGVATAPLRQPDLTPDNLAHAIRVAVSNRTLAERAEYLGCRVREEGGVAAAVGLLEAFT